MLTKRIASVSVALTLALGSVAMGATSASALAPGSLEVLNSSGGTSSQDGLRVEMAFGQIQIIRNGSGQFFGPNDPPSTSDPERLSNYFVVALDTPGTTTYVGDGYDLGGSSWDSFTSEITSTDGDRSGTIVNHLVSGSGGTQVLLDVTLDYTYPNDFVNVDAALTLGADYASTPHRIYWYTDSYFAGSDFGYSFTTLDGSSKRITGVSNDQATAFQAYRQTSSNLNWWAGQYVCPYATGSNPGDCTTDTAGAYVQSDADFPNAVSALLTDNGIGISSNTSTGNQSINFDLLFSSCDSSSSALLGEVCPSDTPSTLPDTGTAVFKTSITGLGLMSVGFYIVAMSHIARRRGVRNGLIR